MVLRRVKYILSYYLGKKPEDLNDFISCIQKVKQIPSDYSKKKVARSLKEYAKFTLQEEEFEFISKKLRKEFNIK